MIEEVEIVVDEDGVQVRCRADMRYGVRKKG